MSYQIGQFNQKPAIDTNNKYATLINETMADTIVKEDSSGLEISFDNPCLKLVNREFDTNEVYYLHAIIKRLTSNQVFDIKLAFENGYSTSSQPEQQLRKEVVTDSSANKNVDIELIFKPRNAFDMIVFELKRERVDYGDNPRIPLIAFVELSIIKNVNPVKPTKLSKIGVQSHPDLLMCINGEEMHMPRSGIFELRDGVITYDFFSVVKAATLNDSADLDTQLENGTTNVTFSTSGYPKTRIIDAYTLDYMYDNSQNNT